MRIDKPSPQFTKFFESANQTITTAGGLTIAHGLGVVPKLIQCYLKCVTADISYSVGMLVPVQPAGNGVSQSRGFGIDAFDATNITVTYGSTAPVFTLVNKATGANSNILATSWRAVFRVWA